MELNKAYEILGVDAETPKSIIKKKYLKLAKKYHPDVAKPEFLLNNKLSISIINEAYSCIEDSFKKTSKFNVKMKDLDYKSYTNNTDIYNLFQLNNSSRDLGFDIFSDFPDDIDDIDIEKVKNNKK